MIFSGCQSSESLLMFSNWVLKMYSEGDSQSTFLPGLSSQLEADEGFPGSGGVDDAGFDDSVKHSYSGFIGFLIVLE